MIVTDEERLADIRKKAEQWRRTTEYLNPEPDILWLLEKLDERDRQVATLEARMKRLREDF